MMAVFHPARHSPKFHTELLLLLAVLFLLILSALLVHLVRLLPIEKAVPQPVVASAASQSAPLHFSKLQGTQSHTEAVPRPITITANSAPLQAALTELLQGPTPAEKAEGYYSEIPAGTRLLGVRVQGDTVWVNLSHEFTSGGGSTSMLQRVNELETTIHSVAGNRAIKIAIEGKPLHVLGGEGLELDQIGSGRS